MTHTLFLGILGNWMCFLHFCGRVCEPGCEWQTDFVLNPQYAGKGDWMSWMPTLSFLEGSLEQAAFTLALSSLWLRFQACGRAGTVRRPH